jgi:bifunctional non-homologous end joining protein LigD
MTKSLRWRKVLIDSGQNDQQRRPCALRARDPPTVSTPVGWEEVRGTLDADDPDRLTLECSVLDRVAERGELFAGVAGAGAPSAVTAPEKAGRRRAPVVGSPRGTHHPKGGLP